MAATLLLSSDGLKALGRTFFRPGERRRRGVKGSILGYQNEGVWFQDARLLKSRQMVLIKWKLIEAILSEAPIPEPERARTVGFQA